MGTAEDKPQDTTVNPSDRLKSWSNFSDHCVCTRMAFKAKVEAKFFSQTTVDLPNLKRSALTSETSILCLVGAAYLALTDKLEKPCFNMDH